MDVVIAAVLVSGLVAAVAWWVSMPLRRGELPLDAPDQRAVALLAQREAVLASLRDLEADHASGRVADAPYAAQRTELVTRGAATLAALDAVAADLGGRAAALAEAIEAEVAAASGSRA